MRHGYWICAVLTWVLCNGANAQSNWPRLRGPNGEGQSDAVAIPQTWSGEDYNWKIRLPGVGHSSPVIWSDRIYITAGDAQTAQRFVLCLRTTDGSVIWRRDFDSQPFPQHPSNCYATATPAADDQGVVVNWTTPDEVRLMALDPDGRTLWQRNLGPFVGPHGSGSSPVIERDMVILSNMQEDMQLLGRIIGHENPDGPIGASFVAAVDRKTGEDRWQLARSTTLASYSTPCLRVGRDDRPELIFTSTSHGISAVDLATGRVNWEVTDVFPDRCVGSPILADDLVIGGYGHGSSGALAIAVRSNPELDGEVGRVVYEVTKSVPLVPTPIVYRGLLFLWADTGVVSCLQSRTGELVWQQRVGGNFFGSPVCVSGRLYCIDKEGTVVVIAASEQYELLGRVPLGEASFATPAVAGGVMYLRTASQLFSLGGK